VFTAKVGESCILADDVELPRITVYIPKEKKMMLFMAGSASQRDPLVITTGAQLSEIANLVNMGRLESFILNDSSATVYLKLGNDIDLSAYSTGEGWMPIGTSSKPFKGHFDGNNKSITGLKVNRPWYDYMGLFGCIDGRTVKNVSLTSVNIYGKNYVGGLGGKTSGTVQCCYADGVVNGSGNSTTGRVAGNWEVDVWDSSIAWIFEKDKLPILRNLPGQSGNGSLYLTKRDITRAEVETTNKQPVNISGITMTGGVYNGKSYGYKGTPVFNLVSDGSSINIENFTVLYQSTDGGGYSSPTAPTDAGEYLLTISIPEGDDIHYTGSQSYFFSIQKRSVTVKANDMTMTAGERLPSFTYTVKGELKGDTELVGIPALICKADGSTEGTIMRIVLKVEKAPNASGELDVISNSIYDPVTGRIGFTTKHFSLYAVGYNKVNFKDVAENAWYSKAVTFISTRRISTGTGDGNFNAGANLTRGQFMVMLMKAYGIAPDIDIKDNFEDVGDTYYTGYLATAKRLNIARGIGNNMFGPEKEITHQEMATLLYNGLKAIGRLPERTDSRYISSFDDANSVAPWTYEAMKHLVEVGIMRGNEGRLNPNGMTTRGEMAQVLYNLLMR